MCSLNKVITMIFSSSYLIIIDKHWYCQNSIAIINNYAKKEERANLKPKSISSFSHECKCVLLEYCSSIVFLQNKF